MLVANASKVNSKPWQIKRCETVPTAVQIGACWHAQAENPLPPQVKAYSKRALLPDRLLGEFSVVLAHPGATANLSGELAKKKTSSGTLSFKIYPKGNSKLHHGAPCASGKLVSIQWLTLPHPKFL